MNFVKYLAHSIFLKQIIKGSDFDKSASAIIGTF